MVPPARPSLPTFAPMAPHHQRTLVLVGLVALVALVADRAWHTWWQAPLVDLDVAPRRSLELDIDINKADWPELSLLPNIGESLAKRIITSREQVGPFQRPADLRQVRGIGPKTLEQIEPYLAPLPAAPRKGSR